MHLGAVSCDAVHCVRHLLYYHHSFALTMDHLKVAKKRLHFSTNRVTHASQTSIVTQKSALVLTPQLQACDHSGLTPNEILKQARALAKRKYTVKPSTQKPSLFALPRLASNRFLSRAHLCPIPPFPLQLVQEVVP